VSIFLFLIVLNELASGAEAEAEAEIGAEAEAEAGTTVLLESAAAEALLPPAVRESVLTEFVGAIASLVVDGRADAALRETALVVANAVAGLELLLTTFFFFVC
jgi:hypothetical protein